MNGVAWHGMAWHSILNSFGFPFKKKSYARNVAPVDFSLRLRDVHTGITDLRFAQSRQKIPAPAAPKEPPPVPRAARVQAATCLSQLAHPSAGDQLF
jgi:hypothetical protein